MEEKIIVWEAEATAEDLAKKVAELMKEDLVGFTRQEGSKINFRLVGGQSFVLTVEKV